MESRAGIRQPLRCCKPPLTARQRIEMNAGGDWAPARVVPSLGSCGLCERYSADLLRIVPPFFLRLARSRMAARLPAFTAQANGHTDPPCTRGSEPVSDAGRRFISEGCLQRTRARVRKMRRCAFTWARSTRPDLPASPEHSAEGALQFGGEHQYFTSTPGTLSRSRRFRLHAGQQCALCRDAASSLDGDTLTTDERSGAALRVACRSVS